MNLLGAKNYDPTGGAVTKVTTALLAMTALDTSNLRIAFTIPAHGFVHVRMSCVHHGGTTTAQGWLGCLEGSTLRGRCSPTSNLLGTAIATTRTKWEVAFTLSGLTPGAVNWDAAYGVEIISSAGGIKYGGPNNATTDDGFGGFNFEIWDPQPLTTALDGGVNVKQWSSGAVPAPNVTGVPIVDDKYLLGTVYGTPATAGIMDVNVKNIDNDAASASGTVTFPGTVASTTNITAATGIDLTKIDGQATSGNNATLNLKQLNIVNSAGDAIIASSTGSNGLGLKVSGNGTGPGVRFTGGGGAFASAMELVGGPTAGYGLWVTTTAGDGVNVTSGNGTAMTLAAGGTSNGVTITASGTGSHGLAVSAGSAGNGIQASGGTNGAGISGIGSGVSGAGIKGVGAINGAGIQAIANGTGTGFLARGGSTSGIGLDITGFGASPGLNIVPGATGNGVTIVGGATSGDGVHITATSGDGIDSSGGGAGVGLRTDITANITGNLSGSVGSVTGLTAATVHSDLDDIQARLPAALVGGRMDSSVGAIAAGITADANLVKIDGVANASATLNLDTLALAGSLTIDGQIHVQQEVIFEKTMSVYSTNTDPALLIANDNGIALQVNGEGCIKMQVIGDDPTVPAIDIQANALPGTGKDGIRITAGNGGHAINVVGDGDGNGIHVVSGATAVSAIQVDSPIGHGLSISAGSDGVNILATGTGVAVYGSGGDTFVGLADNLGNGIITQGSGSGSGIKATGGDTGHGMHLQGGAAAGDGLHAFAPTAGSGISGTTVAGAGIHAETLNGIGLSVWGTDDAIHAESTGIGNGIQAVGVGVGAGIRSTGGDTGHALELQAGVSGGNGIYVRSDNGNGIGVQSGGGGDALSLYSSGAGSALHAYVTGGTDAVVFEANGSGAGIKSVGGDTGHGMHLQGGGTTGDGLHADGTGNNGSGIRATSEGDTAAMTVEANGTGGNAHGLAAYSVDQDGIHTEGGANGNAFWARGAAAGAGIKSTGGDTGHGMHLIGAAGQGLRVESNSIGAYIHSSSDDGLVIDGGSHAVNLNSYGDAVLLISADPSSGKDGVRIAAANDGAGIKSVGGDTGHGMLLVGGATSGVGAWIAADNDQALHIESGNGVGVYVVGGSDNSAIEFLGAGSGSGIKSVGGDTGHGMELVGGASSGNAFQAYGPAGHAISAYAEGAGGSAINVESQETPAIYVHGNDFAAALRIEAGELQAAIYARGYPAILAEGVGDGDGIKATSEEAGAGIKSTGGNTGHGMHLQGGATSGAALNLANSAGSAVAIFAIDAPALDINGGGAGTGAVLIQNGSADGDGIQILGAGSGSGIKSTGGDTGHGMHVVGGATSGEGLFAQAQGDGSGLNAAGGVTAGSGASFGASSDGNHGLALYGLGSGHGLHAEASGGLDIDAPDNNLGTGILLSEVAPGVTVATALAEVWKIHGLDPDSPLVVDLTTRVAGLISQTITTVGDQTTVQRI